MCAGRKQTPAYMCECNRGGAPYTLMSWGDGGFLNFWQFLFGSPLKQPSLLPSSRPPRHAAPPVYPFHPGGFCRESFLSLGPRVDSPPVVAALSAVFRRRSGGNNARAVSQYRAIIYFRGGPRGGDACGEGKQNVRQLLNVAGAAAPRWVDFAGVVIEDNWEQSPRGTARAVGPFRTCVRRRLCNNVRACERRHPAVWQPHTYTLIHVRDVYGSARGGENTEGILEVHWYRGCLLYLFT